MGSSGSKAASSAARKFPTRIPLVVATTTTPQSSRLPSKGAVAPKKQYAPAPSESQEPSDFIDMTNPGFSARLNKMGIVDAYASVAPLRPKHAVLAHNPTLEALESRQRIQRLVDGNFDGSVSRTGYMDIGTIRRMVALRGRGSSPAEIDKTLRLYPGTSNKLGRPGVLSSIS